MSTELDTVTVALITPGAELLDAAVTTASLTLPGVALQEHEVHGKPVEFQVPTLSVPIPAQRARAAICYPLVHDAAPVSAGLSVASQLDFWALLSGATRRVRTLLRRLGSMGEPVLPQMSFSFFERPRRHRSTWLPRASFAGVA